MARAGGRFLKSDSERVPGHACGRFQIAGIFGTIVPVHASIGITAGLRVALPSDEWQD